MWKAEYNDEEMRWMITNGEAAFWCKRQEDAEWLAQILNMTNNL